MIGIEQARERTNKIVEALIADYKERHKPKPPTPLEQLEQGQSAVFYKFEEKWKWRN